MWCIFQLKLANPPREREQKLSCALLASSWLHCRFVDSLVHHLKDFFFGRRRRWGRGKRDREGSIWICMFFMDFLGVHRTHTNLTMHIRSNAPTRIKNSQRQRALLAFRNELWRILSNLFDSNQHWNYDCEKRAQMKWLECMQGYVPLLWRWTSLCEEKWGGWTDSRGRNFFNTSLEGGKVIDDVSWGGKFINRVVSWWWL